MFTAYELEQQSRQRETAIQQRLAAAQRLRTPDAVPAPSPAARARWRWLWFRRAPRPTVAR